MRNNKILKQILFSILFFWGFASYAQQPDLNKKIEEGNKLIFQNPEKAKEIGREVYQKADEDSYVKINALLILAQSEALLANYESSLKYALEAKQIAEKLNDNSYKARVYIYLGYHYQRINLKDKAWEYIDEAEKIVQAHPIPDSLSYIKGNIFFTKASMYQTDLDCNYAITYFNKAIKAYRESANQYANSNIGLAYGQKGYCELELNKLTEAEQSFTEAIENSEHNHDTRNGIYARMGIARIYTLKNNYNKSNELLHSELKRADAANLKHVKNEIYEYLADNYLKLKDVKNYELYDGLYKKSKSEFAKSEMVSVNHILKDVSKQKEKKFFSPLIIGFIVIFILLIGLILMIFRTRKLKSKMKETNVKN